MRKRVARDPAFGSALLYECADPRHFRIGRDPHRDAALETLRKLGWTLPPDFRFNCAEANARGA